MENMILRDFSTGKIAIFLSVLLFAAFCAYSASAKRTAGYVGTEECLICHESTHEEITKAHADTAHAHAMADVTENPEAIVAVFDENAPFSKDDVKYVLGKGYKQQAFLDKDLKLLPAKWYVEEKKWVEVEAVDAGDNCVACHVVNYEPKSRTWQEMGVGCEACHGPGAVHSESMEAKDIVNLSKLDIDKRNMVCGQCHSVGTSACGDYPFSPTYVPGEDLEKSFKVAKDYAEDAANSQYNDFIGSEHAENHMLCITCHDTHGNKVKDVHQLKKPVNTLCMACHMMDFGDTKAIESMEAHAPNAGKDDTCATCHMVGGSHKFDKALANK